jgi:predicted RNA-binding Zn ribbon-like protein
MEFTPIFFSGGLKCIDFCNTDDHLHTPPSYDFFPDRAAILKWGQAAEILPKSLQDAGNVDEQIFIRALKARSRIFALLEPFTRLAVPTKSDLAAFEVLLQEASGWMGIVSDDNGYLLTCRADDPLERILCTVVRSAADVLLSNQPERVKQCGECGWLFYDSTRNLSRRWCDMKSCGNKAKARRHYERLKQQRLANVN